LLELLIEAVIVLVTFTPVAVVVAVNVALVAPLATETVAGTVTAEFELVRATRPFRVVPFNTTVPATLAPAKTAVGLSVMLVSVARFTVTVALWLEVASDAVIEQVYKAAAGLGVKLNVAEVEPAGTTTEVATGTLAGI